MSHYGIIYCCWESEEYLPKSLSPWIAAREGNLGGHTYTICVVSCPFTGFPQPEVLDGTLDLVREYRAKGLIDTFINTREAISEVEARTAALVWLRDTKGCEATIMVDSDEFYLERDILGITTFVEASPFVAWYRLSLLNLVFDTSTRLVDPFTPPRVHRLRLTSPFPLTAARFYDDNNIMYAPPAGINHSVQRDTDLASMTIPESVCAPLHYSWLSTPRSRVKERYQRLRWKTCSYRWNEEKQTIEFDPTYYAARGLPLPQVARLVS